MNYRESHWLGYAARRCPSLPIMQITHYRHDCRVSDNQDDTRGQPLFPLLFASCLPQFQYQEEGAALPTFITDRIH